ncbi:MAG: gluconokinase [Pyrinomonadaceae bacterium]
MSNEDSSLVLVLDVGTSSVRAALYDEHANRLDATFVKNERTLTMTEDGGAEIDADEALNQVAAAINEVLEKAGDEAMHIKYVSASCFWHSLVGVDAQGKALTPVYGWADTRSAKYVKILRESFDEHRIHNRTGARFHPSYWTAKLLWLKTEQPQVFEKVEKWLSFADFLALSFFGEAVTSVSQASGTGIFDLRKCVWDDELTGFLEIKRQHLPRIADDQETFGLNKIIAKRFQHLAQARWFLAIGDGAANNIGASCVTSNRAALMIGTSGAMRVVYEGEPPEEIPAGLWCYRLDKKRIIIGGALSDGGGLYSWLKNNLKLAGVDDDIENQIAALAPDSHGLTFLPFLAGERSTNWNAAARGAILGLHSSTSAIEITQAALEAVAYRFSAIFEQLNGICQIDTVIASGGALRESPVWTQIICDVSKQKLTLPDEHEASSRGAALYALEQAGKIENIATTPIDMGQCFTPDAAKHEIYQKARQRQEEFYQLIYSVQQ